MGYIGSWSDRLISSLSLVSLEPRCDVNGDDVHEYTAQLTLSQIYILLLSRCFIITVEQKTRGLERSFVRSIMQQYHLLHDS